MPRLQAVVWPLADQKWQSQIQDNRTTVHDFSGFLCFKFINKSTKFRHTPRLAIPLKWRQLQGRTHILLLVRQMIFMIVDIYKSVWKGVYLSDHKLYF